MNVFEVRHTFCITILSRAHGIITLLRPSSIPAIRRSVLLALLRYRSDTSMTVRDTPRILAVEDNPDTQLLLRYLLRPHYELEIVPRVDDALESARRGQFDLLILDINLGEDRTGIDLLLELRKLETYQKTPALALTAYAMPGDRERFEEAGFNEYISKPFTRKELYEALRNMLNEAAPG